jgi:hypothetical protein
MPLIFALHAGAKLVRDKIPVSYLSLSFARTSLRFGATGDCRRTEKAAT